MTTTYRKLATVGIDSTTQIPKIDIEFNMPPAVHYRWNIVSAARTLVEKPEERELTLMVYNIHKKILRGSGVSEEALERGDKRLIKRVEMYVKEANLRHLRSVEPKSNTVQ
jgi:hypothetical protein